MAVAHHPPETDIEWVGSIVKMLVRKEEDAHPHGKSNSFLRL